MQEGSHAYSAAAFSFAIFAQHSARVQASGMAPVERVYIAKGMIRMLWKRCRCGALIPQGMKACEACAAGVTKGQKSRHMEYNEYRRNKRAAAFYVSADWRKVRENTLKLYGGMDLYAFYVQHKIVTADMVHHIIELDEDWNRRLDPENLFPLSNGNHGIISALYKKEETKKQTQKQLEEIIRKHWEEAGGIKKVLYGSP